MTALVVRTYHISCDGWNALRRQPCSSREVITPPAESQGAASEYVLRTLRRARWRYEPRTGLGNKPRHYCPDHRDWQAR